MTPQEAQAIYRAWHAQWQARYNSTGAFDGLSQDDLFQVCQVHTERGEFEGVVTATALLIAKGQPEPACAGLDTGHGQLSVGVMA